MNLSPEQISNLARYVVTVQWADTRSMDQARELAENAMRLALKYREAPEGARINFNSTKKSYWCP